MSYHATPSQSGWKFFAPGRLVKCPHCDIGMGVIGLGLSVEVRIHPRSGLPKVPGQPRGDPTRPLGYSERCKCGTLVEYAFEVVNAQIRPRADLRPTGTGGD